MTFKLPKFGLDPLEWREVQRLRRTGLAEQADALEAHYKSGERLPTVDQFSSCFDAHITVDGKQLTYDELKSHPQRHLVKWMIENGRVGMSSGL